MNKLTSAVAVAFFFFFLAGCGPDWGECRTCKPGEPSAESVDGSEDVPVDVNVTVIVNVTNTNTNTNTNTDEDEDPPVFVPPSYPVCPAPPPHKECRKICTVMSQVWKCDHDSSHCYTKKKAHTNCHKINKCVKEELQCK